MRQLMQVPISGMSQFRRLFRVGFRSDYEDIETVPTFENFLSSLTRLIDGTFDCQRYEEICTGLYGSQAFQLFTLDRLALNIAKMVKYLIHDISFCKLHAAWQVHREI